MPSETSQVPMVYKSINLVLKAKAFRVGYEEALRGLPLDPDRYGGRGDECWNYERGRQFAHLFQGSIKNGNKIRLEAIYTFGNAVARGLIV